MITFWCCAAVAIATFYLGSRWGRKSERWARQVRDAERVQRGA